MKASVRQAPDPGLDKTRLTAYCPIMGGFRRKLSGWGGFGAAMIALAVMVQVLIPQGFMASAQTGGYPLVICTGHGPLLSAADSGLPGKAPKPKSDTVCPYAAAHGATTVPPAQFFASAASVETPALLNTMAPYFAPGRRLAAPPPPSQASPTLLI